MRNPMFSLKFAFVISISFAASSSSSSSSSSPFLYFRRSSSSPKSAAAELLSLLGTRDQAAAVDKKVAEEFRSCLRFLVPLSPPDGPATPSIGRRERFAGGYHDTRRRSRENEMVWWPPAPVMELARLAVNSRGDPAAIHQALDPTILTVPDVEGCKEHKCQLTRTPYGWRFINEELNSYIAFLFELIASRGPLVGLNVSLSRYDLFHGRLFLATDSGRLGILFHAKEYPSYDKEVFPYNMGYCQKGSNVKYDESINFRNILWLAPLASDTTKAWLAPGVLVILDAHPEGIIYQDLVPEYVDLVRTIYEDDFGELAVDVNYLNVENAASADKIFVT